MLVMLVYATHWLYMHLYTLAYMSIHKSCLLVCRPCFNTMKLWTFDPNLHLSLTDTTFCSFFACLLAFLLRLPCLSRLSILCLFIYSLHLFLPLLVCRFLVSAFACTHMERGCMELGHNSPGKSKRDIDASMWLSQATVLSRFRSLASLFWLCTLLNPFPSFSFSPIDGLY